MLKDGRTSTVARVFAGDLDCVVKRYNLKNLRQRCPAVGGRAGRGIPGVPGICFGTWESRHPNRWLCWKNASGFCVGALFW